MGFDKELERFLKQRNKETKNVRKQRLNKVIGLKDRYEQHKHNLDIIGFFGDQLWVVEYSIPEFNGMDYFGTVYIDDPETDIVRMYRIGIVYDEQVYSRLCIKGSYVAYCQQKFGYKIAKEHLTEISRQIIDIGVGSPQSHETIDHNGNLIEICLNYCAPARNHPNEKKQ